MQKLLILAALAAASVGQPALAQTAPSTVTAVVQHRDLELGTEAGARTLKQRIWHAVVTVCGTTSEFDLAGKNDIRQCRRDTLRSASAEADVVIASAGRDTPIRVSSIQK